MRIFEIIGETADTWKTRHANHQRQQQRKAKLRSKLAAATAASYQQHRTAADRQARANDKMRSIKRDLADASQPPKS